jgi:hypothetical protein
MTAYPADSAGERADDDEPAVEPGLTGFDAELAAALKDLGEQAGTDEFDAHAILRRTARRRTSRVLISSATALAVVVGATAFAAQHGSATGNASPASPSTSSAPAVNGTDPLILPGYLGTADSKPGSPFTYSVYGAFGGATDYQPGVDSGIPEGRSAQDEFSYDGTEYTIDVGTTGIYDSVPKEVSAGGQSTVVATIDGRPAYLSYFRNDLAFWTGPQGYALLAGFVGLMGNKGITNPAVLIAAAKAFDATPVAVPLPLRITGLDSAQVSSASIGQRNLDSAYPWSVLIDSVIDGRRYQINATPGLVTIPWAPGKRGTTGEVWATKMADGVGIAVTTVPAAGGSPSAPTVAQVLAHVTSLGTEPSKWTTAVIVK